MTKCQMINGHVDCIKIILGEEYCFDKDVDKLSETQLGLEYKKMNDFIKNNFDKNSIIN